MKFKRALCCFVLLATLSACASKEEEKDQEAKDEATKEEKTEEAKRAVDTYKPHLICPQVAIVHELELAKNSAGDQLAAAARMKSIAGTCSYQDKGIDIEFTLDFTAVKGPHLGGDRVKFPYFVAVVDPDQTILNKNEMSVEIRFKSDEKTATQEEPLHVFIPLPKDQNTAGPNYRVLTGFQLTPEQLAEVRQHENTAVGLPAAAAPSPAPAK